VDVTHFDPPADLARTRDVDAATGYGLPQPPVGPRQSEKGFATPACGTPLPSPTISAFGQGHRVWALRPRRSAIRCGSSRSVSEPPRSVMLTDVGLRLLAEARCRIASDRSNRDGQRYVTMVTNSFASDITV
jgi:hypothetical protein